MRQANRGAWARVGVGLLIAALVGCGDAPKTKKAKSRAKSVDTTPLVFPNMPSPDVSGGAAPGATAAATPAPVDLAERPREMASEPSSRPPATATAGPGELTGGDLFGDDPAPAIAIPEKGPAAAPLVPFRERDSFAVDVAYFEPHANLVVDATYTPDGRFLLVLSQDGELRVIDAVTRKTLHSAFPLGKSTEDSYQAPRFLAAHPDGRRVAIGAATEIHLVELPTIRRTATLPAIEFYISALRWTPDGRRLLVAESWAHVKVLDGTSGRVLKTYKDVIDHGRSFMVSPDARHFLGGQEAELRAYALDGDGPPRTIATSLEKITAAAFTPNGEHVAVFGSDGKDPRVVVLSWPEGAVLHSTKAIAATNAVVLRDGRTALAVGGDLAAIDVPTGRVLFTRDDEGYGGDRPASIATSPFNDEFAIVRDDHSDRVTLRTLACSSEDRTIRLNDEAYGSPTVAASPDGELVATFVGEKATLWNAETGERGVEIAYGGSGVFSADGRRLLLPGSDGGAYDPATGAKLASLENSWSGAAVASKSNFVVGHVRHGTIELFDPEHPDQTRVLEGSELMGCELVAFSSDGDALAIADSDGRVEVWNIAEAKRLRLFLGDPRGFVSLSLSPGGRRVAGVAESTAGHVWVWDVAAGERATQWKSPDATRKPTALAFVGETLAIATSDGRVLLWDEGDPSQATTLLAHHDEIGELHAIGAAPRFVTSAEDRTVKVWTLDRLRAPDAADPTAPRPAVPPHRLVTTGAADERLVLGRDRYGRPLSATAVAVSPDGRWIAAAAARQNKEESPTRVRVWNAATRELAFTFEGSPLPIEHLVFSRDGEHLLARASGDFSSEDHDLRVWSTKSGTEVAARSIRKSHLFLSRVNAADEFVTAFGGGSGRGWKIEAWDFATLKPRTLVAEAFDAVEQAAVSPAGDLLALAHMDAGLRLHDFKSGALRWKESPGRHRWSDVTFDSRGTRVVGVHTGDVSPMLTVYDVASRRRVHFAPSELENDDVRLRFTPDDRWLVAIGRDELWILDGKTYEPVRLVADSEPNLDHEGGLTPDGKTIVAADAQGVGLWSLASLLDVEGERRLAALDDLGFRLSSSLEEATLAVDRPDVNATLRALDGLRIESLSLSGSDALDSDALAGLASLPRLRELSLSHCGTLSPRTLDDVARASKLESLELSGTKIDGGWTRDRLATLAAMPKLRALWIVDEGIDAAALAGLAGAKLESLTLQCGPLTAEGLARLGEIKTLQELTLTAAELQSPDLSPLAGCRELTKLSLRAPVVDDAIAPSLAKLASLRALDLGGSEITDATLETIAELPRLEELTLYSAEKVTAAGKAKLKERRPKLDVGG